MFMLGDAPGFLLVHNCRTTFVHADSQQQADKKAVNQNKTKQNNRDAGPRDRQPDCPMRAFTRPQGLMPVTSKIQGLSCPRHR